MLGWYVGELRGTIRNVDIGVEETYMWVSRLEYQPNGDVSRWEFLYIRITIWVDVGLSHIDLRAISSTYDDSYCMVCRLK
jgi:hypothetical protein